MNLESERDGVLCTTSSSFGFRLRPCCSRSHAWSWFVGTCWQLSGVPVARASGLIEKGVKDPYALRLKELNSEK